MSTINPIILIEAIIKEGNISAAAESLFVSQPYLSKLLKQIERDIGLKIFNRHPREMQLTYAGERYLVYLKQLDSVEQEMKTELDMIANYKKAKIKIGVNPALGSTIFPQIIPDFVKAYPDIEIEFFEEDAASLEYLVENHLIDVVFGIVPSRNRKFEYHHLYEDNMHLVVSNSSPLYNPDLKEITPFPYSLSALHDLPLISLTKGNGVRKIVDDFYDKYDLKQNIQLETSTIYSAIALVQKGLGHTFIPVTGMAWPSFVNCNVYMLDSDILKSTLEVYYLKDRSLSPILKTFIDNSSKILKNKKSHFAIQLGTEQINNQTDQ